MDIISIIKYVILGIIQGITEPLPISSSGHLLIFRELLNTNMFNDLNFEIIVNFGSFLAILFIFRKDIITLIKSFFNYLFGNKAIKKKEYANFKYCILIIIGSIPVGIAGLLLKEKIEAFSSVKMAGIALYITAIALFLVRNIKGSKKDNEITYLDAIIIGLIQAIALTPGISRSGTVLVGCLLCSLTRESALKYTFMLYFPVSVGSFGLSMVEIINNGIDSSYYLPYFLGLVAACIVTYFSYLWLSNIVKKGKLWHFSIYCLIVATFVLIYFR